MSTRREFLGGIVAGAVLGLVPIPKWLGDPAGGFYAPPPDLTDLVKWSDWKEDIDRHWYVRVARTCVIWAPPGSSEGQVQFLGGDIPCEAWEWWQASENPSVLERKERWVLQAMRDYADDAHTPGWFRVHAPHRDPTWRRVGYVAWVHPDQVAAALTMGIP